MFSNQKADKALKVSAASESVHFSALENKARIRQIRRHCKAREPLSFRTVHFLEQLTNGGRNAHRLHDPPYSELRRS